MPCRDSCAAFGAILCAAASSVVVNLEGRVITIKVPDWWDSIRAILALVLCGSYCYGVIVKIPATELTGLKELAVLALTFYFVLKKRQDEKEGGQQQ